MGGRRMYRKCDLETFNRKFPTSRCINLSRRRHNFRIRIDITHTHTRVVFNFESISCGRLQAIMWLAVIFAEASWKCNRVRRKRLIFAFVNCFIVINASTDPRHSSLSGKWIIFSTMISLAVILQRLYSNCYYSLFLFCTDWKYLQTKIYGGYT